MITSATPATTNSNCSNRSRKTPKKKCPECGRQKLRRLIGPGAAIVFKGSGFYKTDYRSESYKKAAAAEKSSAAAAGSDGKKTETTKSKEKKERR